MPTTALPSSSDRAELAFAPRPVPALSPPPCEADRWATGRCLELLGIARCAQLTRAWDDRDSAMGRRRGQPSEASAAREAIRALLRDGKARTLHTIGLELWGVTAEKLLGTAAEETLWDLVVEGEVEHTTRQPLLFRATLVFYGLGTPTTPAGCALGGEHPDFAGGWVAFRGARTPAEERRHRLTPILDPARSPQFNSRRELVDRTRHFELRNGTWILSVERNGVRVPVADLPSWDHALLDVAPGERAPRGRRGARHPKESSGPPHHAPRRATVRGLLAAWSRFPRRVFSSERSRFLLGRR